MIVLPMLDDWPADRFPPTMLALKEPDGLLAFGGDLSPTRLSAAYAQGVFPWFSEGEPILWWSPDPRCVFRTADLHANRSLRRLLARSGWCITADHAFEEVMTACAAPRPDQPSTWISPAMIEAYTALHRLGHAHSMEVWEGDELVGGIYGVASGRMFSGESMFSLRSGGSRVALIALGQTLLGWGCPLIDAQVSNPHLETLGAVDLPRDVYLQQLAALRDLSLPVQGRWSALDIPRPA